MSLSPTKWARAALALFFLFPGIVTRLGVGAAFSLKCTAKDLNDDLARRTGLIVSHLAETGRTRVVRLALFLNATGSDICRLLGAPLLPQHLVQGAAFRLKTMPSLRDLLDVCTAIDAWLKVDHDNVAVVHCTRLS